MRYKNYFAVKNTKSVSIGTGLIALDVVINGNSNTCLKLWTGGSCGNVLAILSYLGWESYPIARLSNGKATKELLKDFQRWKVNTHLISTNDSGNTPIIVEKIGVDKNGNPRHRFAWKCPNCGSWLPKYKPILHKDVVQISKKMPKPHVFYFDRVTRSSIELAKISKDKGALIVFEPSGVKDKNLFFESLLVADIVKYSHVRIRHAREFVEESIVPLEIETLGSQGLRYRYNCNGKQNRKWKFMNAYSVTSLKDAAGSGDWCSAGIIHLLGIEGRRSFENAKVKDIETALSFGQALATLNCYYEGARGSMYNISKKRFRELVCEISNGSSPSTSIEEKETNRTSHVFKSICSGCRKTCW